PLLKLNVVFVGLVSGEATVELVLKHHEQARPTQDDVWHALPHIVDRFRRHVAQAVLFAVNHGYPPQNSTPELWNAENLRQRLSQRFLSTWQRRETSH